jgi:hypothetical protein
VGRDVATAAFMGLNTLGRFIELERKIREQEEIIERIELLEAAQDSVSSREGGEPRRWRGA